MEAELGQPQRRFRVRRTLTVIALALLALALIALGMLFFLIITGQTIRLSIGPLYFSSYRLPPEFIKALQKSGSIGHSLVFTGNGAQCQELFYGFISTNEVELIYCQ